MVRRLLLLLALLLATPLLSCYVRSYGPPPGPRCHNACAYWGTREHCSRVCRIWTMGRCMAWESRCQPQRVCMRYETRCH